MTFSAPDLAAIAAAEEIRIETTAADGTAHRTIIWIMVDKDDVSVRSVNGPDARWYREATASGEVALHVDGRRIPARVEPAADPDRVAACSAAIEEKYRGDPSVRSMLQPETLPTTLRVVPA